MRLVDGLHQPFGVWTGRPLVAVPHNAVLLADLDQPLQAELRRHVFNFTPNGMPQHPGADHLCSHGRSQPTRVRKHFQTFKGKPFQPSKRQ
jgi:hypothetical protein